MSRQLRRRPTDSLREASSHDPGVQQAGGPPANPPAQGQEAQPARGQDARPQAREDAQPDPEQGATRAAQQEAEPQQQAQAAQGQGGQPVLGHQAPAAQQEEQAPDLGDAILTLLTGADPDGAVRFSAEGVYAAVGVAHPGRHWAREDVQASLLRLTRAGKVESEGGEYWAALSEEDAAEYQAILTAEDPVVRAERLERSHDCKNYRRQYGSWERFLECGLHQSLTSWRRQKAHLVGARMARKEGVDVTLGQTAAWKLRVLLDKGDREGRPGVAWVRAVQAYKADPKDLDRVVEEHQRALAAWQEWADGYPGLTYDEVRDLLRLPDDHFLAADEAAAVIDRARAARQKGGPLWHELAKACVAAKGYPDRLRLPEVARGEQLRRLVDTLVEMAGLWEQAAKAAAEEAKAAQRKADLQRRQQEAEGRIGVHAPAEEQGEGAQGTGTGQGTGGVGGPGPDPRPGDRLYGVTVTGSFAACAPGGAMTAPQLRQLLGGIARKMPEIAEESAITVRPLKDASEYEPAPVPR